MERMIVQTWSSGKVLGQNRKLKKEQQEKILRKQQEKLERQQEELKRRQLEELERQREEFEREQEEFERQQQLELEKKQQYEIVVKEAHEIEEQMYYEQLIKEYDEEQIIQQNKPEIIEQNEEEIIDQDKEQDIDYSLAYPRAFSFSSLVYYYNYIFPKVNICNWLSHHKVFSLKKRELMFSYYSLMDPEEFVVTRGRIINNVNDLLSQLVAQPIVKIDVGPIYNKIATRIADEEEQTEIEIAEEYKIIAKELVIDIDLTDYDEVRRCCQGHNICNKCWKYAAIACYILNKELKNYWKLKHILWVFSGRRGLHGWVCDRQALHYTVIERKSIISFFNLLRGTKIKKVKFSSNLHPLISDNFEICLKFFEQVCMQEQNLLDTRADVFNFLHLVPKKFRNDLAYEFSNLDTSLDRWHYFLQYYKEKMNQLDVDTSSYKYLIEEIVVQYTFPRLDIPVSSQLNHLLKCPFSMHPKTSNLALVIDPYEADVFDVENTVKLDDLVNQHTDVNRSIEPGSALYVFKLSKKLFNQFVEDMESDT